MCHVSPTSGQQRPRTCLWSTVPSRDHSLWFKDTPHILATKTACRILAFVAPAAMHSHHSKPYEIDMLYDRDAAGFKLHMTWTDTPPGIAATPSYPIPILPDLNTRYQLSRICDHTCTAARHCQAHPLSLHEKRIVKEQPWALPDARFPFRCTQQTPPGLRCPGGFTACAAVVLSVHASSSHIPPLLKRFNMQVP